jgi:hypothetical protein
MADIPTNESFLLEYPEFEAAPEDLVTKKLEAAARRTNADVYQTAELANDAVMMRAAILLMRSSHARKMRLASPDQIFVWEGELFAMQRSATMGLRVF